MVIAVRCIGAFLLVMALLNLAAVVVATDVLINPVTVAVRYSLMLLAAVGYLLAYKWGVFTYAALVAFNWIAYLTIYEREAIGPLWLSIPVPLAIFVISALAWRRLK